MIIMNMRLLQVFFLRLLNQRLLGEHSFIIRVWSEVWVDKYLNWTWWEVMRMAVWLLTQVWMHIMLLVGVAAGVSISIASLPSSATDITVWLYPVIVFPVLLHDWPGCCLPSSSHQCFLHDCIHCCWQLCDCIQCCCATTYQYNFVTVSGAVDTTVCLYSVLLYTYCNHYSCVTLQCCWYSCVTVSSNVTVSLTASCTAVWHYLVLLIELCYYIRCC